MRSYYAGVLCLLIQYLQKTSGTLERRKIFVCPRKWPVTLECDKNFVVDYVVRARTAKLSRSTCDIEHKDSGYRGCQASTIRKDCHGRPTCEIQKGDNGCSFPNWRYFILEVEYFCLKFETHEAVVFGNNAFFSSVTKLHLLNPGFPCDTQTNTYNSSCIMRPASSGGSQNVVITARIKRLHFPRGSCVEKLSILRNGNEARRWCSPQDRTNLRLQYGSPNLSFQIDYAKTSQSSGGRFWIYLEASVPVSVSCRTYSPTNAPAYGTCTPFTFEHPTTTSTTTTTTTTTTAAPTSAPLTSTQAQTGAVEDDSRSQHGSILPGVLGAVCGLAVIFAAIALFVAYLTRKKKMKNAASHPPPDVVPSVPREAPSAASVSTVLPSAPPDESTAVYSIAGPITEKTPAECKTNGAVANDYTNVSKANPEDMYVTVDQSAKRPKAPVTDQPQDDEGKNVMHENDDLYDEPLNVKKLDVNDTVMYENDSLYDQPLDVLYTKKRNWNNCYENVVIKRKSDENDTTDCMNDASADDADQNTEDNDESINDENESEEMAKDLKKATNDDGVTLYENTGIKNRRQSYV